MPIPVLKVFLLGESGSGKTTLRAALARRIAFKGVFNNHSCCVGPHEFVHDPGPRTRGAELQLDASEGSLGCVFLFLSFLFLSWDVWMVLYLGCGVIAVVNLALVLHLDLTLALALCLALALVWVPALAYYRRAVNGPANRLLLWDYGGQAEFSVSHRYFLGATNAAFVLVLSLSNYESGEHQLNEALVSHMKHWLAVVCGATNQQCTPNSVVYERPPVYLVFSRADTLQEKGLAQAQAVLVQDEAVRLFGDKLLILEGGVLDCRKTAPVQHLVDALEGRRKALVFRDEWRRVLPLYDALLSRVKCSESPLIRMSELEEIVSEVDQQPDLEDEMPLMSEADAMGNEPDAASIALTLARIMDHQADAVYLEDELPDWVVLQPKWLCGTLFGSLIDPITPALDCVGQARLPPEIKTKKQIVKQLKIDPADTALVDTVMHLLCNQFQLCYPHPVNLDQFVVPLLMKQDRPAHIDGHALTYGRAFLCQSEADAFHPSLFFRLQVHKATEMVWYHNAPGLWFQGIQCEGTCGIVVIAQFETVLLTDGGHAAVVIRVGAATDSVTPAMMMQELKCWNNWLQNNHLSGALVEHVLRPCSVYDLSSKPSGLIPLETLLEVQASGRTRLKSNVESGEQSSWVDLEEVLFIAPVADTVTLESVEMARTRNELAELEKQLADIQARKKAASKAAATARHQANVLEATPPTSPVFRNPSRRSSAQCVTNFSPAEKLRMHV